MKIFIKITVILFVSLALQNCGPKDHTNPDVQMISEEIKEWGIFKIGTWWVYEEETSKLRDSIYVYMFNNNIVNISSSKDPYLPQYQKLVIHTISSLGIDTMFFETSGTVHSLILSRIKSESMEFSPYCNILPAPPIVQGAWSRSGPPSQITQFDTIYPNLQIGDFNFTNVIRANNNMNLAYNYTPTLIYSAKHFGIVRKEFPEYNQVWNLVRYNIVQ